MKRKRKIIFIPMYNCGPQISRVLRKFNSDICQDFEEVLIVDNGSTDNSLEAATEAKKNIKNLKVTIVKNVENYNLGGSHKVAFNYAVDKSFDYIVVLHGDDQGDVRDVLPVFKNDDYVNYDCILGSRFMKGSRLNGYSKFRIYGNLVINLVGSIFSGKIIKDMGAGLNIYNVEMLKDRFYLSFPNGLTFNYYLLFYTVAIKRRFKFFPLSWSEDDQVSNLNLFNHSKEWLEVLLKFIFQRKIFLKGTEKNRDYKFEVYSDT